MLRGGHVVEQDTVLAGQVRHAGRLRAQLARVGNGEVVGGRATAVLPRQGRGEIRGEPLGQREGVGLVAHGVLDAAVALLLPDAGAVTGVRLESINICWLLLS